MERNLDRKTLSFSKGMTNVPSDLLSDDSELLESDGFIYKDGEMKAVQNPVQIGTIPYKIMYVHKMADYENIIAYDGESKIYWYTRKNGDIEVPPSDIKSTFDVGCVTDIKSVGNTLTIATTEGVYYLLYKGGKYKDLGRELPVPDIKIELSPLTAINEDSELLIKYEGFVRRKELKVRYDSNWNVIGLETLRYIYNNGDSAYEAPGYDTSKQAHEENYLAYGVTIDDDNNKTLFQNAVIGNMSAVINKAKEKNLFCFPFFARYALRMFDGTYIRISNPIICYPCVSANMFSKIREKQAWFVLYGRSLLSSIDIPNKEDWNDIIKGVTFFATKEVIPFKLDGKWRFGNLDEVYKTTYHDCISADNYDASKYGRQSSDLDEPSMRLLPESTKTQSEILDELVNNSVFYKVADIDTQSELIDGQYHNVKIKDGILSTLETQEQLSKDDYYGWAHYIFNKLFNYNGRLNTIGAKREPFEGFTQFCPKSQGYDVTGNYIYYVHILSNNMSRWAVSKEGNAPKCSANGWFFYPDPNACEVIIYDPKNKKGIKKTLKQHPRLNGAFAEGLIENNTSWEEIVELPEISGEIESLDSQIFTSVVNNPFVFEASGDNTVGTGKILGIVANTEAVSQGQFGQYPLMVFTDEGIYGLSVNSEGLYSASYPISREVCLENSPLVPTDRLVFFASKKGLMAASGGSVGCMSELMRGRVPRNFAELGEGKFLNFLKDCLIAYDYRDSLLRIFCKGKDYQYIYNMVDKTFSMVSSGIIAQAVVNDYPDNLIQDTSGNVYSLTGKPDINDDEEKYSGHITTRPLKLGGSMTLKSLRAIKNLVDTDDGKINTEIWGSNDCKHWCKLVSLGGKPWKYFTFKYTLKDFKAVDSFAGSVVEVQSRREDKMR